MNKEIIDRMQRLYSLKKDIETYGLSADSIEKYIAFMSPERCLALEQDAINHICAELTSIFTKEFEINTQLVQP